MAAPQIKSVTPNYSYSSAQYDDPNDTYDSTSTYDGGANIQTQFADNVLVDVLSGLLILLLPISALVKKFF